jgi:hypothetical protein
MISVHVIGQSGIRGGIERFLGREQNLSLKIVFTDEHNLSASQVRELFGWSEESVSAITLPGSPEKTFFQALNQEVADFSRDEGTSSLTFFDPGNLDLAFLKSTLGKHLERGGSQNNQIIGFDQVASKLSRK